MSPKVFVIEKEEAQEALLAWELGERNTFIINVFVDGALRSQSLAFSVEQAVLLSNELGEIYSGHTDFEVTVKSEFIFDIKEEDVIETVIYAPQETI